MNEFDPPHREVGSDRLERRLDRLNDRIDFLQGLSAKFYEGETRTLKWILGVGGGLAALVGFLSALQFIVNTERVKEFTQDLQRRVDDNLGKFEIISAKTSSALDSEDAILAQPDIRVSKLDTGVFIYRPYITMHVRVSTEGRGIGKVIGLFIKYKGQIATKFSMLNGNVDDFSVLVLNKGHTRYFSAIPVDSGSSPLISFELETRSTKCDEAVDFLNKLAQDGEIGEVSIRPIFESIRNKPENQNYRIKVSEMKAFLTCEQIAAKTKSNEESK